MSERDNLYRDRTIRYDLKTVYVSNALNGISVKIFQGRQPVWHVFTLRTKRDCKRTLYFLPFILYKSKLARASSAR